MASVEPPQAPALPHARDAYKKADGDTYTAILRLFFNRLTALLRDLLSSEQGGAAFYYPHAQFVALVDQSQVSINLAIPVEFDTTSYAEGIALNSNTQMQVERAGKYLISFEANVSGGAAGGAFFASIRKNGTFIDGSGCRRTVTATVGSPVSYSFIVDAAADDYFEVTWAVAATDLTLNAAAANSYTASRFGALCNITFVSNVS